MSEDIKKGLLGIVVDETEVSKVMPEINSLTYRGYAAQDLCEYCKFEEVAYLILNKDLPNTIQLKKFEKEERCMITSHREHDIEACVQLVLPRIHLRWYPHRKPLQQSGFRFW